MTRVLFFELIIEYIIIIIVLLANAYDSMKFIYDYRTEFRKISLILYVIFRKIVM